VGSKFIVSLSWKRLHTKKNGNNSALRTIWWDKTIYRNIFQAVGVYCTGQEIHAHVRYRRLTKAVKAYVDLKPKQHNATSNTNMYICMNSMSCFTAKRKKCLLMDEIKKKTNNCRLVGAAEFPLQ
jgi:hypothetical protein